MPDLETTPAAEFRAAVLAGAWVVVVSTRDGFAIDPAEIPEYDGDVCISIVRSPGALDTGHFSPDGVPPDDVAVIWWADVFGDTEEAVTAHIRAVAMAAGLNAAQVNAQPTTTGGLDSTALLGLIEAYVAARVNRSIAAGFVGCDQIQGFAAEADQLRAKIVASLPAAPSEEQP